MSDPIVFIAMRPRLSVVVVNETESVSVQNQLSTEKTCVWPALPSPL